MPDMLAFLAGLRVDGDTITLDGETVCFVLGHTGQQLSTVEAAEWIAEACNQASRTCETCRFWQAWEPGLDEGTCSGIISRTALVRRAADFCSLWQGGERDAAR